jgi:DNA-directed RNA polymerase subunit RPC12/RpoP
VTPEEIAALYLPISDVATHRQVFTCPECGVRLYVAVRPGKPKTV